MTMSAIQAVVETGIYVDDLDRAEAFYHQVLGLPIIAREPSRHVVFRVGAANVLLAFNAATTLQGDRFPAHGTTGPGYFALGIPAGALEDWKERLRMHQIAIEKEVSWPGGGQQPSRSGT